MSSRLERRTIYCTPHWKRVPCSRPRDAGYLCQTCRAGGRTVAASMVHHVRSIRAGETFSIKRTWSPYAWMPYRRSHR